MTQPGDLNRRLVLEAPIEVSDGAGGVTRTYQAEATLWARVMAVRASPDVSADSLSANVTHRIVIRAPRVLSTMHRFRDGARIFNIAAYRESAERSFVEIEAQERED